MAEGIIQAELEYFDAINDGRSVAEIESTIDKTKNKTRSHVSSIDDKEIVVTKFVYNNKSYYYSDCGNVFNKDGKYVGTRKNGEVFMFDEDFD